MRPAALLLGAALAGVAGCSGSATSDDVTGSAGGAPSPDEASPFDQAAECHGGAYGDYLYVADGGTALILEIEGEDSPGAPFDVLDCVFTRLDMPISVITRIERTRALDGTLDASWDQFEASWTYHPDSGLNLIVESHEE